MSVEKHSPAPAAVVVHPGQAQGLGLQGWASERFDCFSNMGLCLLGCCCDCILFGQSMERSGSGGCVPMALLYLAAERGTAIVIAIIFAVAGIGNAPGWIIGWILVAVIGFSYRKQLVEKYNAQGANLAWEGDGMEFAFWCCCGCCSNIQEYKTWMTRCDMDGNWLQAAPDGSVVPMAINATGPPVVLHKDDAMPAGWSAAKDPKGVVYYYNASTGETTWTHPNADTRTASRSCC